MAGWRQRRRKLVVFILLFLLILFFLPRPGRPAAARHHIRERQRARPVVIKVGDRDTSSSALHLAAAKTTDLMNWTQVADGVNNTNPLFTNVTDGAGRNVCLVQVNDLWAPDVVRLADGKFYIYYDSCKGDSPCSALGVAVAD